MIVFEINWNTIIPSVITGSVSLAAIGLSAFQYVRGLNHTKKNLEKQLRIQYLTSVNKEWTDDLIKHTSNVIHQASVFNGNDRMMEDYYTTGLMDKDLLREVVTSMIMINALLDLSKPKEKELLVEITSLTNTAIWKYTPDTKSTDIRKHYDASVALLRDVCNDRLKFHLEE